MKAISQVDPLLISEECDPVAGCERGMRHLTVS